MKKVFSIFILSLQVVMVMAQVPLPFQKRVRPMPESYEKPSENTDQGKDGRKTISPWIVFSDRDENFTTTAPGGSLLMKKLNFMEPFYVGEEKDGYLKLIRYGTGLLNGRKINDKKNAVSYGWIDRSKLLMWHRSFMNVKTGYPEKSIAVISGKLPLTAPQFYYDRTDSAFVYSSPELKKVIAKVRLHEINYVFKKSADGRKFLIGNEDQLITDSARKVICGWVAADAVHHWGERLYISPAQLNSGAEADSASVLLSGSHADPLLNFENLVLTSFPVIKSGLANGDEIGIAADVYDKSHNTLTTINGSKLNYPDYLDLRKNIHRINLIFVIDGGSTMSKYFAGLTNTIQSFENIFTGYGHKYQMSYGAVVYRDEENCVAHGVTTNPISPDYRQLMSFLDLEAEKTKQCNGIIGYQPIYQGIRGALDMIKLHPNETNLVVLIGSTGASALMPFGLSADFGSLDARLLAIQMYSDYNQLFNNFVLQSKKMVLESAVVSAQRKKGLLINGEGLTVTQSYNTSQLDSLPFYLDYPNNSLIQGGVVFPTKGAVTSNKSMTVAVKRFLKETDLDIHNQISSLDSAFRLSGITSKNLSAVIKTKLEQPVGADVADKMPHNGFKYFMTSAIPDNVVSQHKDLLQYSIVLNSMEYKQLNDILSLMTGQNIQPDLSSFRKKLVKNYKGIPRKQLNIKISGNTIRSMTLAKYLYTVTGLPLENQMLDHFTVNDLKSYSRMPRADFEKYLQFLTRSGEHIKTGTQLNQQFISNGKTYYYITQKNFDCKPEK